MNKEDQALAQSLGQVENDTVEPGRARIAYDVRAHMRHSGGAVQGGYVCAWIDSTMAYAAMSLYPDMIPLSLELKVSFFGPARSGRVVAEAWIERRGRTVCFAEGQLSDECGAVLAKGTSTIHLAPRVRAQEESAPSKE